MPPSQDGFGHDRIATRRVGHLSVPRARGSQAHPPAISASNVPGMGRFDADGHERLSELAVSPHARNSYVAHIILTTMMSGIPPCPRQNPDARPSPYLRLPPVNRKQPPRDYSAMEQQHFPRRRPPARTGEEGGRGDPRNPLLSHPVGLMGCAAYQTRNLVVPRGPEVSVSATYVRTTKTQSYEIPSMGTD